MLTGGQEYLSRFERLHRSMQPAGLDGLMVYAQGNRGMCSNLLYLTGYYDFDPSLLCVLLIHGDGTVRLFSNSEWDLDRAARTSWIERGAMEACDDVPAHLAEHWRGLGLATGRLGVVGMEQLPLAFFRGLDFPPP